MNPSARAATGWKRLMIPLLIVAFGLRAYHLDFQSLWSDEGISLLRSSLPFGQMLREMPVEHVPGYFAMLHGWLLLGGASDFSLRFLSLWPSVLAVAVAYRLAVDLGSRQAGLIGALLLATNPFHIWYAQEVRMYSWLLVASLVTTWLLWRLLTGRSRHALPIMLGYALVTTGCVYLHFYGFLVPLAHSVFVLGWLLHTRNWSVFFYWVGAGALVLLLFLPWAPRAFQIFSFQGWREAADPVQIPWRYLTAYTVGDTMSSPWRDWLPGVYLALAFLGLLSWLRHNLASGIYLAVNLLVPLAVVLMLAVRNPDFHERYAIAMSAPLLLLAAAGIEPLDLTWWRRKSGYSVGKPALGRWGWFLPGTLVIAGLIGANLAATWRLYTVVELHKPNFRTAAQYIQEHEQPGDVVLIDGPDPRKVFLHYYRGTSPVTEVTELNQLDGPEVAAAMGELTAGARHAWELLYFHAPGPVQVWLATQAWATAPTDHNDIRVTEYGLAGPPMISTELNVPFGLELKLQRAEVDAGPLHPGDLLRVSTHWWVTASAPELKFSLRLSDGDGNLQLARDYVPQNNFAPTHVWLVDRPATDRRGLLLPEELAAGRYRLTLRLYDPATGIPVDTPAGQDVPLADIDVLAP